MNPLDLRWLWRALRGRSVTFALVFFLAMAGLSAPRLIRGLLDPLSLPWLVAWLSPLLLLALLAKMEPRLIPSDEGRKRIALGLVVAGLLVFFAIPRLLPVEGPLPAEEPSSEQQAPKRLKPPSRR